MTVSDGTASDETTFTVTVTPVNDLPTISDVSNQTLAINQTGGPYPVTISDRETASSSLILAAQSSNTALVPQSGLSLGGSFGNRTISVTPAANQSGQATITLSVSDGTATASDTFVVTVTAANQPPIVQLTSPTNGASFSAPATFTLNADAIDSDGTVARVDFFSGGTLLGSDTSSPYGYTLSGAGAGNLALTARATDNFGLIATSSVVNVTVTSAPTGTYVVNGGWLNVPQANQAGTFTAEFDAVPSVAPMDCVLGFSNGSANTYSAYAAIVRFNTSGYIDARNGGTYSANSQIPYSANTSYHFRLELNVPAHTYSIFVTQQGGSEQMVGSNYLFRSEQSSVTQINNFAGHMGTSGSIQVTGLSIRNGSTPNQPPTISPIANQILLEDAASATVNFTIGDADSAITSLALSASSSNSSLIANDNLTLGGTGTNRTLSFRPTPDQSGSAVITVTVNDGQASASTTFTVNVTPVNDLPTISDVSNQTLAINQTGGPYPVTISDRETTSSSLTLAAQSSNTALVPQSGLSLGGSLGNRTISVTPAANQSGQATITLSVSDGTATASDTFVVTVTAANQPPIVQLTSPTNGASFSAPATFTMNADAIDSDGTIARVDFYNGSTSLGFDTSSPYSITLSDVAAGNLALTARATDNSGSIVASGVVNVTITSPPTITGISNQTILEDSSTTTVNFTIEDSDTAMSNLVLSTNSSNTTLIANAILAFGGAGTNRTLSFRPAPDQSGSAPITVTVSDGTASDETTFTVTVTPVNDLPTISDVSNQTLAINQTGGPYPVTISDRETTSGLLTLTAQSSNPALVPQAGLLLSGSAGNRTISVTPAANQTGQALITLTVSDGAATASDSFTVTVTGTPAQTYVLDQGWMNVPVENQTGTFTAEFDAIPSNLGLDAVIGFSDGAVTAFRGIATIVRFNTSGWIDARNGGTYSASSQISYAPNVSYHFRLTINVAARTYSIYVTPSGGSERVVGTDYRFRSEQSSVLRLNNFVGHLGTSGSVQVSGLTVRNDQATALSAFATQPATVEENFEAPGYENGGWFEVNNPKERFGSAGMEGSYSLNTSYGAQAYRVLGGVAQLNLDFMLAWLEVIPTHTIVDFSDSTGQPAGFVWFSNGQIKISHGNVTAAAPFQPTVGNRYYFWLNWTEGAGSNGLMELYISSTERKPAAPITSVWIGDGQAIERVYFGGAAPDSPSLLLDRICLSKGQ